jgi:hypothetical protein
LANRIAVWREFKGVKVAVAVDPGHEEIVAARNMHHFSYCHSFTRSKPSATANSSSMLEHNRTCIENKHNYN